MADEDKTEQKPPAHYAPAPMSTRGAMRNAWALSKETQAPLEGTAITKQALDVKLSAVVPVPLPKKPEPPPPVEPPPAPEQKGPRKVDTLHDVLAQGRKGMQSMANENMETPLFKPWADEE